MTRAEEAKIHHRRLLPNADESGGVLSVTKYRLDLGPEISAWFSSCIPPIAEVMLQVSWMNTKAACEVSDQILADLAQRMASAAEAPMKVAEGSEGSQQHPQDG